MIEYKQTKEFTAAQLQRLFLSVNWESGVSRLSYRR